MLRRLNFWMPICYCLTLLVWSYVEHRMGHWSTLIMFGWEHGNIAEALVKGRGFSDSMGPGSGPTAWMPPLFAWINAALFLVFGLRTPAAMAAGMILKACGYATALVLVTHLLRRCAVRDATLKVWLLGFVFLYLDYLRTLFDLEDVWLNNLAVIFSLCALMDLHEDSARLHWRSALAGFLLPLISPVISVAYLLCSWSIGGKAWRAGTVPRAVLVVTLMTALSGGAWTLRNKLVLGHWYPIKSNMWYDFVEANLWDDDGILTDSIFFALHPVNPNSKREEYVTMGEARFLDSYHQEAAAVTVDAWLTRTAARLFNATVYLQSEVDVTQAFGIEFPDQCQLHYHGLVGYSRGTPLWLYCRWPEPLIRVRLEQVPLQNRVGVERSRELAKAIYYKDFYLDPRRVAWSLAHTLFVTLSIGIILVRRRLREEPAAALAIGFYAIYLMPYLMVSHYERYQVSLVGLQIFLICLATARLRPPSDPE